MAGVDCLPPSNETLANFGGVVAAGSCGAPVRTVVDPHLPIPLCASTLLWRYVVFLLARCCWRSRCQVGDPLRPMLRDRRHDPPATGLYLAPVRPPASDFAANYVVEFARQKRSFLLSDDQSRIEMPSTIRPYQPGNPSRGPWPGSEFLWLVCAARSARAYRVADCSGESTSIGKCFWKYYVPRIVTPTAKNEARKHVNYCNFKSRYPQGAHETLW